MYQTSVGSAYRPSKTDVQVGVRVIDIAPSNLQCRRIDQIHVAGPPGQSVRPLLSTFGTKLRTQVWAVTKCPGAQGQSGAQVVDRVPCGRPGVECPITVGPAPWGGWNRVCTQRAAWHLLSAVGGPLSGLHLGPWLLCSTIATTLACRPG